ncbi:hypothetical protein BDZ91DRAFT_768774 [Kalaharituber pfeilii]|nr:hypothetical protein BDZ91DRAFT_768774 [Kalaharituber pfeilii]
MPRFFKSFSKEVKLTLKKSAAKVLVACSGKDSVESDSKSRLSTQGKGKEKAHDAPRAVKVYGPATAITNTTNAMHSSQLPATMIVPTHRQVQSNMETQSLSIKRPKSRTRNPFFLGDVRVTSARENDIDSLTTTFSSPPRIPSRVSSLNAPTQFKQSPTVSPNVDVPAIAATLAGAEAITFNHAATVPPMICQRNLPTIYEDVMSTIDLEVEGAQEEAVGNEVHSKAVHPAVSVMAAAAEEPVTTKNTVATSDTVKDGDCHKMLDDIIGFCEELDEVLKTVTSDTVKDGNCHKLLDDIMGLCEELDEVWKTVFTSDTVKDGDSHKLFDDIMALCDELDHILDKNVDEIMELRQRLESLFPGTEKVKDATKPHTANTMRSYHSTFHNQPSHPRHIGGVGTIAMTFDDWTKQHDAVYTILPAKKGTALPAGVPRIYRKSRSK